VRSNNVGNVENKREINVDAENKSKCLH
jgi:hypothetical protein